MNNQEPKRETPHGRIIREAKEQCFHARRQLRDEMPDPSLEMKRAVAVETASYYDALKSYADDSFDDDEVAWTDRLPVDPERLVGASVAVDSVSKSGRGRRQQTRQMPAAAKIEPETLLKCGQELDAIAKQLGFAAHTDEEITRTKITNELIEEVEKWRKQNLA